MKHLLLFSCAFLIVLSTYSQSDKNIENQFLVNALWPGISYEMGIARNTAIKLDAGTSIGAISFDGSGFNLYPRLDAQLRQYYNFERRSSKGKNTAGNSGNFYGINMYYTSDVALLGSDFEPEIANIIVFGPASFETFYIGATYGLQRTYTSGFNWGLQFGIGAISVDYSDSGGPVSVTERFSVYPNLRITVGWVLGKKSK